MRILERLDQLYAIGGGVGANRPGYSASEDEAHELAAGWMREAGLEVEVDAAGNLIGRTANASVWAGSHLDSVPNGGKFDGALGVVAAIEAVERAGAGAVVAFRDEETGCGGSTAFVQGGGLPACFLEVHVEQGPVLERAEVPFGLVTGITGMVRGERVFEGEAGHAGTVPMAGRRDAPVAAAEGPRNAFRAELESRALPVVELPSGAGHDAAVLAEAGVPAAMLFVRSLNGGISHSPDELSSVEDVELAVDVLAGALARLVSRPD